MLSVREMLARLRLLQQAQLQGRDTIQTCRIPVRQMPLVTAGEDASEYIPYAVHPDQAGPLTQAVRRLREHMVNYLVEGVTVSAHKLPQQDARARAMMQHLRASQPQLSTHLLHHWCADPLGAGALRSFLHDNWAKAWRSELATGGPAAATEQRRLQWLGAVHILLLALIRQEIQRLPDEHVELTDFVMVHVLGASCSWMLQEFVDEQLADTADAQRLAAMISLAAPMPALAFFRRQPKGQVFSDAAHMVTAYGLEAELLPRLRQVSEAMPGESAAAILGELAVEPLSDHLLKRSWARLSLRHMGESSGQGVWQKWAMDVKRLDALLSQPERVASEMQAALAALEEHPLAAWLLARGGRGNSPEFPWRQDERLLQVFQLFEQDAALELERRIAAQRWLNRESVLVGPGRGSEAGRILGEAHAKGKIVLLQKDARTPLFVSGGSNAAQGVLYIDWTEYLRVTERRCGAGMPRFLSHAFQPGVIQLVRSLEGVFADSFSASGMVLRGSLPKLLHAGIAMRQLLHKWYEELDATSEVTDRDVPVVSMCLATLGEWSIAPQAEGGIGGRVAFSQGLAQAKSAVSRNDGLHRLLLSFGARDGKRPPGQVRVEAIRMADGKSIPILCNRGFALTGSALQVLLSTSAELHMQGFQGPAEAGNSGALASFRLPGGRAEGFVLHEMDGSGMETDAHLLLRIGKVLLATTVEDIYEVLDADAPGYMPLMQLLPQWQDSRS